LAGLFLIQATIYRNNIRPNIKPEDHNSTYAKCVELHQRNYEKLLAMLDTPEKEQLEKYIDAVDELEEMIRYSIFTSAIKFGALFMTEVISLPREVEE